MSLWERCLELYNCAAVAKPPQRLNICLLHAFTCTLVLEWQRTAIMSFAHIVDMHRAGGRQ